MSPRGASRTTRCTPAEARSRRTQARAFIDVAEMVLGEPPEGTEAQALVRQARTLVETAELL